MTHRFIASFRECSASKTFLFYACALFQGACKDDQSLQDLGAAATAVTRALDDLLQHIKRAGLGAGGKTGEVGTQLDIVTLIIYDLHQGGYVFGSVGLFVSYSLD